MGLPALIIVGGATLLVSPTLRRETLEFGKGVLEKAKRCIDVILEEDGPIVPPPPPPVDEPDPGPGGEMPPADPKPPAE